MDAIMIPAADGTPLRTWTSGPDETACTPVVMLHGGPGIPDYLAPIASVIDDLCLVHRYDQRGVGGSVWAGEHTIARHVEDLGSLLDAWGHERVILFGHSYGSSLANYLLLAHPERVARLILVAGPWLEPWRDETRATRRARRTPEQQSRLDELDAIEARSDADEIEYLTLSWMTDHADPDRAAGWARASALTQRPVNYVANEQLNEGMRADPLESHVEDLARLMPSGSVVIAGEGDPRPASALVRYGGQVGAEVVIIPGAGHDPWLERPALFAEALRASIRRGVE